MPAQVTTAPTPQQLLNNPVGYYPESFFQRFKSLDELATYINDGNFTINRRVALCAALFSYLQDKNHYNTARDGFGGDILNPNDGWKAFINSQKWGVCRDNAGLVKTLAEKLGLKSAIIEFTTIPESHAIPALYAGNAIYLIDQRVIAVRPGQSAIQELQKAEGPSPLVFVNGRLNDVALFNPAIPGLRNVGFGLNAWDFRHVIQHGNLPYGLGLTNGPTVQEKARDSPFSVAVTLVGNNDSYYALKDAILATVRYFGDTKLGKNTHLLTEGMVTAARVGLNTSGVPGFGISGGSYDNDIALANLGAYLVHEWKLDPQSTLKALIGIRALGTTPMSHVRGALGTVGFPVMVMYQTKGSKGNEFEVAVGYIPYVGSVSSAGRGIGGTGFQMRSRVSGELTYQQPINERLAAQLNVITTREIGSPMSFTNASLSLSQQLNPNLRLRMGADITRENAGIGPTNTRPGYFAEIESMNRTGTNNFAVGVGLRNGQPSINFTAGFKL